MSPCNRCSDKSSLLPKPIDMGETHTQVLSSYFLCTSRDDFIIDKCIWVVDLKDGTKVFQDDDRPGCVEPSAWKRLGHYVKDYPQNSIAKMRLRFGTHIVELPDSKPFYFYSKGLVQAITQSFGLDFHIVGWRDNTGQILSSWYKVPELVVTQTSYRSVDDCQSEQIIGLTNSASVL